MLVLSRGIGQWVIITLPNGQKVEVTVTRSGRKGATLGFNAPPDVKIDRDENVAKLETTKKAS